MPKRLNECPLFDYCATSAQTRAAAHQAAKPSMSKRQSMIFRYVVSQGETGATREEISLATGIILQSVCGPTLQLLRERCIRENGTTRKTSSGNLAAVLVAIVPQIDGVKAFGDLAAESLRRHGIVTGGQHG